MTTMHRWTARVLRAAVAAIACAALTCHAAEDVPSDYVDWACALKVPGMPCNAGGEALTGGPELPVGVAPGFPGGAAAQGWAGGLAVSSRARVCGGGMTPGGTAAPGELS